MMITLLILLLVRQGAGSKGWSVTFAEPDLCVPTGSSVALNCSYDYPDGQTVHRVRWSKGVLTNGQWSRVELSLLPALQNRSYFAGDLQHDCQLVLNELEKSDSGYYYFRFDTDTYGWRSRSSVFLTVTDVNASVYPAQVEKDSKVTLECLTSCEHVGVVWFKDGEPLSQPELQARPQDSGNYSCALEGWEWAQSNPVALDVQYPPVNVAISMHPSNVSGGSVNLTCTSDSQPAAENYTWYWRTHPTGSMQQVGSGQLLSLLSVEASHSGLYLCQARNQLGEGNSTELLLLLPVENVTDMNNLILLISFGVKVVIILSLTWVLFWACFWRRRRNSSLKVREETRPDNEFVYDSIF